MASRKLSLFSDLAKPPVCANKQPGDDQWIRPSPASIPGLVELGRPLPATTIMETSRRCGRMDEGTEVRSLSMSHRTRPGPGFTEVGPIPALADQIR